MKNLSNRYSVDDAAREKEISREHDSALLKNDSSLAAKLNRINSPLSLLVNSKTPLDLDKVKRIG